MKPVRSLPQVIEMLLTDDEFIHRRSESARNLEHPIYVVSWSLAKIEFQSRCRGGSRTAPTGEKC